MMSPSMSTELTPRYQEIAAYLRRLIAASKPGDRLPSEAELCERFGVSRMTVRQALQLLANEHLLVRRRGEGTFAAPRVVPRLLGSPLSFTESMRRRGLHASSRLLHAGWIEPSAEDRAALHLPIGSRAIVVERLRLADDRPMAIERVVSPPSCAGILEADLEGGSLHDTFERLGRIPTRAQARVSARLATDIERSLLGLDHAGVVLSERRTIDDQDGIPIEHTETLYAAERYEFEAVLKRGADAEVM
jgi:GntR family transcriptional regulator